MSVDAVSVPFLPDRDQADLGAVYEVEGRYHRVLVDSRGQRTWSGPLSVVDAGTLELIDQTLRRRAWIFGLVAFVAIIGSTGLMQLLNDMPALAPMSLGVAVIGLATCCIAAKAAVDATAARNQLGQTHILDVPKGAANLHEYDWSQNSAA